MKPSYLFLLLSLGITANAQLDIWKLGTVPYGEACAKDGHNGFGLPIDDPWPLTVHCITYGGTVGCTKKTEDAQYTTCECNQGEDTEFVGGLLAGMCVGKVGAECSYEHSSLIPDKKCTANADCVPEQGEDRFVGRCKCLDGYMETADKKCVLDPDASSIGTPRVTTTTVAPPANKFEIPPLNLLIGFHLNTPLGEECHSSALLNRTYCNSHWSTVSCLDKKCQCNMREDSVHDPELGICVGRVGSYCLARRFVLGFKACAKNADCILEEGTILQESSFGTCQCVYGYKEDANGLCARDESISNPSTPVPLVPTTTPSTPSSSSPTSEQTTTPDSGATGIIPSYATTALVAIFYILYQLN